MATCDIASSRDVPASHRTWAKVLLTCTLSMGSHYGSYLLGPLKHRLHEHLHTTNTQFSLLLASYSINSTWTPLVAGLAVSRMGVYQGAILATAILALGQIILLIGSWLNSLALMAAGLFLFGLAFSPLSVCQETLIYTLFPKSSNLNLLIGCGLLAGKMTAFAASITAVPLSDVFGDHAPFVASALLAAFSCCASIALWRISQGDGHDDGETASHLQHKAVRLGDLTRLGNVFWLYVLMNVVGGYVWQPFLHLSSSMIEHIYGLSDRGAAVDSSVLLAGAIVMYPALGWIVDRLKTRSPATPFSCMLVATVLTAGCYAWLLLPSSFARSPVPGLILFAAGYGGSSFLLVVLVSYVVGDRAFISTGLGMHKSMEMCSTTLSQTLSGLFLDWDAQELTPQPRITNVGDAARSTLGRTQLIPQTGLSASDKAAARGLLTVFVAINCVLIGIAAALRWLYLRYPPNEDDQRHDYQPIALSATPATMPSTPATPYTSFAPLTPLLSGSHAEQDFAKAVEEDEEQDPAATTSRGWTGGGEGSSDPIRRPGKLRLALTYIAVVWVVFWAVMAVNSRRRK